jgi:hypothetical protein
LALAHLFYKFSENILNTGVLLFKIKVQGTRVRTGLRNVATMKPQGAESRVLSWMMSIKAPSCSPTSIQSSSLNFRVEEAEVDDGS